MTKSFDESLNTLLQGVGEMPALFSTNPSKVSKPLIASSIHRAKGQIKGAIYENSPYEALSEELVLLSDGFAKQPVNELEEGLFKEAFNFINYVAEGDLERGIEPFSLNLPTYDDARKAMDGDGQPKNVVELLVSYRKKIDAANTPIKDLTDTLYAEYAEQFNPLVNPEKHSLEWYVKKTGASRGMDDYQALLQSDKDLVIAEHTAIGQSLQHDPHPFARSVTFAKLYIMNIEQEQKNRNNRRKDLMKKRVQRFITEARGEQPSDLAMVLLTAEVDEEMKAYSDSGFNSVQSLLPLGAVQFYQFTHNNEIRTKREPGKDVSAFFQMSGPLSQVEVDRWMNSVGETVEISHGVLHGLIMESNDVVNTVERRVSPSMSELSTRSAADVKYLMSKKYVRGAAVWTGGTQTAVLLHATIHKSGVRVYLEDVCNI